MQHYFRLQFQLFQRRLRDFGVAPVLGMGLLLGIFIGGSLLLFHRTAFAPYILALVGLSFTFRLSDARRNDFLQTCFPKRDYRKLRLIENGIFLSPFTLFLLIRQEWWVVGLLVALGLGMSFQTFRGGSGFTLPTPFGKRPFEFAVGFRRVFWLFGMLYFLCGMGIWVNNFNLAAFSLGAIILVCLSSYLTPEHEYYVWIFDRSPRSFLWMKFGEAFRATAWLAAPILVAMGIFYPTQIPLLLGLLAVGFLLVATVISAKYSAFPHEMNIPEGAILALSISIPPLLLVFAPYFYAKALQQLKTHLA